MQGPRGPGSLRVERRREHPFPEPGAILRRREDCEKTVAGMTDAQPLVSVVVSRELQSTNTVDSTVNGYPIPHRAAPHPVRGPHLPAPRWPAARCRGGGSMTSTTRRGSWWIDTG